MTHNDVNPKREPQAVVTCSYRNLSSALLTKLKLDCANTSGHKQIIVTVIDGKKITLTLRNFFLYHRIRPRLAYWYIRKALCAKDICSHSVLFN